MELEFIRLADNSWIPLLNKTLIHSSVDPHKEAAQLVDHEWERLKDVHTVIVLGLGGGFHIAELLKRKNFNIYVIEAEGALIAAMSERWPELMRQIDVFADYPSGQLIQEMQSSGAFTHTYATFKHPACVRVAPLFYKTIQHVLNDRTLFRLRELAGQNEGLSQFLDSLDINRDQVLTLPMVEEALIRRGKGLDREGLIWMTLRELVV
jgi:hypothetical protein